MGCIHFPKKWQGEQHLARAKAIMAKGDYEASFKENKEVLRLFPHTMGDQAIFQMGLIYAHPKNPNSDYQKSLEYFQRIIKEFPKSSLRGEAGIWVLFLQKIMSEDKEISRLNKTINILEKTLEEEKKKIGRLNKTIKENKKTISKLQSQICRLRAQIEKLKEIDLGIEKKKRKGLPQ
jgi:tetratricopeptide (TPR) repeat protein